MLCCKKNNLAPIFTRPKFATRVGNYLRNKISSQILETEIRDQHVKKEKLTRQLKENTNQINNKILFICNIVLYSRIKNIVAKEKCKWEKKLLEDIKLLQINFIMIYIIHKTSVLLKMTRILKCILIFWKWVFLAPSLKNFFIFFLDFKKELAMLEKQEISDILKNGTF